MTGCKGGSRSLPDIGESVRWERCVSKRKENVMCIVLLEMRVLWRLPDVTTKQASVTYRLASTPEEHLRNES